MQILNDPKSIVCFADEGSVVSFIMIYEKITVQVFVHNYATHFFLSCTEIA